MYRSQKWGKDRPRKKGRYNVSLGESIVGTVNSTCFSCFRSMLSLHRFLVNTENKQRYKLLRKHFPGFSQLTWYAAYSFTSKFTSKAFIVDLLCFCCCCCFSSGVCVNFDILIENIEMYL